MTETNPYSPPPRVDANDDAESSASILSRFARNMIATIATLLTLFLVFAGYDWRGGPPPVYEFCALIAVAATGFGLGIGAIRDARSLPFLGSLCVVICGLFLLRGLVGLLNGSLRGFAW